MLPAGVGFTRRLVSVTALVQTSSLLSRILQLVGQQYMRVRALLSRLALVTQRLSMYNLSSDILRLPIPAPVLG